MRFGKLERSGNYAVRHINWATDNWATKFPVRVRVRPVSVNSKSFVFVAQLTCPVGVSPRCPKTLENTTTNNTNTQDDIYTL